MNTACILFFFFFRCSAHDRIILCVASAVVLCLFSRFLCLCVRWMLCVCSIADRFFSVLCVVSSCCCCCRLSSSSSYLTTLLPYWNSGTNSLSISLNLKCCYPHWKMKLCKNSLSNTVLMAHISPRLLFCLLWNFCIWNIDNLSSDHKLIWMVKLFTIHGSSVITRKKEHAQRVYCC